MPVLIPGLMSGPGVTDGGPVGTFPEIPLELAAQAAWGADLTQDPSTWPFADLTCEHPTIAGHTISRLLNDPITISHGVTVGGKTAKTTSATLHLLNHDGALTPFLPSSPHHPYVDVGTPVRLRQRHDTAAVSDSFTRTVASGWGSTADHTWYQFGTPANWSANGSAGLISLPAANGFYTARSTIDMVNSDVLFDIQTSATATGGSLWGGPRLRVQADNVTYYWLGVEFQTAGTIRLAAYRFVNGSATLLQIVSPGVAYTAGQPVRVRVQADDGTLRARAWLPAGSEPSTWTLSTGDGLIPRTGGVGWYWWRTGSNTNAGVNLRLDNFVHTPVAYSQLEGYIADIRPSFEPQPDGTTWSTVLVDVGGVGSRLEKNEAPAFSPMRRSVQQAEEVPVGYWPLEDGEGATYGASAFPGGIPMTIAGPAVFGFTAGVPEDTFLSRFGTKPMVSVAAGASLTAPVPVSTVTSEWAVSVIGEFYADGITPVTNLRVMQWETTGPTFNRWALINKASGGYIVRAYNDIADTQTDVVTTATSFSRATYTVEAYQTGGNINVELFWNDISIGSGLVAGTLKPVSRLTINPDRSNTTASTNVYGLRFVVGHARVLDEVTTHDTPYYTPVETGEKVSADNAWYGEPAHRRIERLCAEERVPFLLAAEPGLTGSTLLNAQQDGAFLKLVTDAAESESGGILYEHGFGYAYLPRAARYNKTPALTVDMATYCRSQDTAQAGVLVPELNSRGTNYWTVERNQGAEGTYAAPWSYRQRRGTIAEKIVLDVLRDADTSQHAAWRTNLTYNAREAHYPDLPVDLAANPDLIGEWLAVRVGSRVVRTNQPSIAGIGDIDQTVDGITETISPSSWAAVVNASPGKVWDVAVVEDATMGKADTDGSTFRAATSTATTLLIDVVAGPRWTTDPAQMPIYVTAATGEDIRIDAISGVSNPQTATVVRSLNGLVKALPADTAFSLTHPARVAL